MNIVLPYVQESKFVSLNAQCDRLNKYCAVLLGFVIPLSTMATHVVLLGFMLTWFFAGDLQERLKVIWVNPIARAFLCLCGIFIIGAFYSVAPLDDRIILLRKMAKLFYVPFLLSTLSETKWRLNTIWAFLGAMLLTFLFGIIKLSMGVVVYKSWPLAAIFKDPIYTNFMMAFASFVIAHYLFQSFSVPIRMVLFGCLMLFTFYVFFMSMGRIGQVVFVALWLLFCLQRLSLKGIGGGMVMLITLFGIIATTSENFQSIFVTTLKNVKAYQVGETNTPIGARLEFFSETLALAKERPWFGFGTGSFKEVYKEHATIHDLQVTRNPHNEYLNILFQLGIVGLLILLGFFGFLFKESFRLPCPEKWFAQGIIIAMVIGCFVNSWLMDFTSGYFFVILTAVSFGAFKVKRDLDCE